MLASENHLCIKRERISPLIQYMVLEIDSQSGDYSLIHEATVSGAFECLTSSISTAKSQTYDPQIAVAFYEFLTFTEAYGWQPLFFSVAESLVPILRSQSLLTVKQHFQGSGFRYLASRHSTSVLSAE
jgi:hypothetical protein